MKGGIKIRTMNDYQKDIEMFKTYLEERGEDAVVQNHLLDPKEGSTSRVRDQATELTQYARWLAGDMTLSVSAFDNQFYAIRRFMIHHLREINAFDMEFFKEARRIARSTVTTSRRRVIDNMETEERKIYNARYGRKFPFTIDMLLRHREIYYESRTATIENKMAYVATALGYHLGNRPSECSSKGPLAKDNKGKSDEDHRYVVEDIQYQLADGSFITGPFITEANKGGIQYISVMVESHKGETIKMKASKGASERHASAIRSDNGDLELQLFNDLIEWPSLARSRPKEIFFSRNTEKNNNLKLTTKAMVALMKETAMAQGVDPNMISAKSLRKALGTDMARSGIPQSTINEIGRWAHNSTVSADCYSMATEGNITGNLSSGITRTTSADLQRHKRSRHDIKDDQFLA